MGCRGSRTKTSPLNPIPAVTGCGRSPPGVRTYRIFGASPEALRTADSYGFITHIFVNPYAILTPPTYSYSRAGAHRLGAVRYGRDWGNERIYRNTRQHYGPRSGKLRCRIGPRGWQRNRANPGSLRAPQKLLRPSQAVAGGPGVVRNSTCPDAAMCQVEHRPPSDKARGHGTGTE